MMIFLNDTHTSRPTRVTSYFCKNNLTDRKLMYFHQRGRRLFVLFFSSFHCYFFNGFFSTWRCLWNTIRCCWNQSVANQYNFTRKSQIFDQLFNFSAVRVDIFVWILEKNCSFHSEFNIIFFFNAHFFFLIKSSNQSKDSIKTYSRHSFSHFLVVVCTSCEQFDFGMICKYCILLIIYDSEREYSSVQDTLKQWSMYFQFQVHTVS